MAFIDKTIEIAADVHDVYEAWTAFADYPKFMETIETVTVGQDDRLHWVAVIEDDTYEWDADVVEHVPTRRSRGAPSTVARPARCALRSSPAADEGDLPARVRPRGLGRQGRQGAPLDEPPRRQGSRQLQEVVEATA